jgi:hypothetical protein
VTPTKHDPPAHVSAFVVRKVPGGVEVIAGGEVLASADVAPREQDTVVLTGSPALTRGDFSLVAREPGEPAAGHDVRDARGEALAFLLLAGGVLELHSPSLDVRADLVADPSGPVVLTWFERPVLRAVRVEDGYAVEVPDRRVDVRVATSLVVLVDLLGP